MDGSEEEAGSLPCPRTGMDEDSGPDGDVGIVFRHWFVDADCATGEPCEAAEAELLAEIRSAAPYAGLKDEQRITDLVAYLKQFDASGKKAQ